MLILSRHKGESIVIGDNITVTVTRITEHQVYLGISAPKEVLILRGELVKQEREAGSDHAKVP